MIGWSVRCDQGDAKYCTVGTSRLQPFPIRFDQLEPHLGIAAMLSLTCNTAVRQCDLDLYPDRLPVRRWAKLAAVCVSQKSTIKCGIFNSPS
jgi:hypothetical protein